MMHSRKALIVALAIPILALAALTIYKRTIYTFGKEVVLPITGYDPRDLLAGHYLIYNVDYGTPVCTQEHGAHDSADGYVCLEPKSFTLFHDSSMCRLFIKGTCKNGRFEAGIERFYIPQEEAARLEKLVMSKNASILLAVSPQGKAQVKDLLIDGKSWKTP